MSLLVTSSLSRTDISPTVGEEGEDDEDEEEWLSCFKGLLNKVNKWFHSSRVKLCQLVFGVDVFDLDFGIQIDSIEQWIESNSVSSGDVSHCRTSSFNDHLDHCFIVLKYIQQSFLTRGLDIWRKSITVSRYIDFVLTLVVFVIITLKFLPIDLKHEKHFQEQKQLDPIVPEQVTHPVSVQWNNFRFCWTVRNWRLFLAHPTYWNKCMTSKNDQCSSRSGFWIFKISREVRVLKKSQSALLSNIFHMTILFVFTCMMNIWNQSFQAFVTSFWFILWLIVRAQLLTIDFQVVHFLPGRNFSEQFSNRFCFFLFEVMVIDAWSRYFVELLSGLVRQLTISFYTLLCMTSHVIRPWRNTKILREW